jgi:hypothetical protein
MVNAEDLIPLKKASEISGLSQEHLALMIRKGEIWGDKLGGRNWFTTKSAIENYMLMDRKPGPKPDKT